MRLGPQARRRDRLVAALAAVVAGEGTAGDGLAGRGESVDRHHQVDVHRPDDDDVPAGIAAAGPPAVPPATVMTP